MFLSSRSVRQLGCGSVSWEYVLQEAGRNIKCCPEWYAKFDFQSFEGVDGPGADNSGGLGIKRENRNFNLLRSVIFFHQHIPFVEWHLSSKQDVCILEFFYVRGSYMSVIRLRSSAL